MPIFKDLKLVRYDNWEALYAEGYEANQDHEISYEEIDEYYGDIKDLEVYKVTDAFYEYLSDYGRFPKTFEECLKIDPNMRRIK
jgi:hypothetical protein